MMMEQQTALTNSELQMKWKTCVKVTCYAYRTVKYVSDFWQKVMDAITQIVENLKRAFSDFTESLADAFRDLIDTDNHDIIISKSYPHYVDNYVDNFKVNTKGFPRPITYCARSRC